VLINLPKVNYRPWTACLVLLTALALSSCTKKEDVATTEPTTPSTPATSTTAKESPMKDSMRQDKTSSPKKSPSMDKTKALPANVEKMGMKPQGKDCPSKAPIKGNVSKKGEYIYHEASAKHYKDIKPEICFADVATAQKAGFRARKDPKTP